MAQQFRFDCAVCDVETTVDGQIRAELLTEGCVLCGASVAADDFTRQEADPEQ
jgi:hypothetical protein